ncbi:MAG: MATE family efflux transporter [Hyphomonadaceae bacterium]|nr:MATE family efflux transporter [Hyphomonadaceae bacterium]
MSSDAVLDPPAPRGRLLEGPILKTLLAMTAPNLVALVSTTLVTIAETAYVGRLGVAAIGGVTLVFPVLMLMQMMSAGAMGGAISGALSRALGARDTARAEAVALSAAVIGLVGGVFFAATIWIGAPALFAAMGGTGATHGEAVTFARTAAVGILAVWIANTLASVTRGSGDMGAPALIYLAAGALQIAVGGGLGLGLGPLPRLGVAGVAIGQVTAFSGAALAFFLLLRSPRSRVRLPLDPRRLSRASFMDILRVGAPAALSPIQSVLTVLILTSLVARYGPEALAGYGIGGRLEFLLIPVAFSIGVACVPMVGAAIGAGDVTRARAVAWTAGGLAMGALATISAIVMIAPDLWARLFVQDETVLAVTRDYLRIGGLGFPLFGLGLCLYFAAQGAGKVGGPIAAQALRLMIVAVGGWAIVAADGPLWMLFALSAFAMAALGLGTAAAVRLTPWGAGR